MTVSEDEIQTLNQQNQVVPKDSTMTKQRAIYFSRFNVTDQVFFVSFLTKKIQKLNLPK